MTIKKLRWHNDSNHSYCTTYKCDGSSAGYHTISILRGSWATFYLDAVKEYEIWLGSFGTRRAAKIGCQEHYNESELINDD